MSLDRLNEKQRQAAMHIEGPLLILTAKQLMSFFP